ncbi:MAG: hypothetical protein Q9226_000097 [Calogaya cf. arnoldii]
MNGRKRMLTWIFEIRGGEEVLLDVGGQDATEAFEDVGHSDEARKTLEAMEKGKLKRMVWKPSNGLSSSLGPSLKGKDIVMIGILIRMEQIQPGDPEAHETSPSESKNYSSSSNPAPSGGDSSMGVAFYALVLLGGGLAFGAYKYLQAKSASESK